MAEQPKQMEQQQPSQAPSNYDEWVNRLRRQQGQQDQKQQQQQQQQTGP
jgi:hypothetical protein